EYKSDLLGFVDFFKDSLSIHNPVVKISDDKLSATMDIYGYSGGKQKNEIQTAHVVDAIKHSKITFGFQDKIISQALEDARKEKTGVVAKIEVVKGLKEINGDDGYIDWFIDIQNQEPSSRIVVAGMRVASRIPLTKGTPGKDIFSKPIQPLPGKDQPLKAGEFVEFVKKEDHDEFFAGMYGIAEFSDNTLSLLKPNLIISDDGLSASVDIYSHTGGDKPALVESEHVIHMLSKCGVTFGIDENAIQSALKKAHAIKDESSKSNLSDVVVANGVDKKDGIPAILQIDHNIAPGKRRPNGTIDLHERSYPWDVSNETVLGIFTQAVMAVDGTRVTSKTIKAEEVNEVNLKLEGIHMEEDGTLIADLDGTLLIDEFNLRVTNVLVIDGDVDMSTGNIRTKSAVQITGFITAGFVVEALGEIIVAENIEDAIVRSGSSIVVHGGIRGPRSEIFAANNIKTSFVEYGKLVAKNDIIIDNSSIDAHLIAGNEIRIGPDPGTLIAGRCEAVRQLWVTNIGHAASGLCEIHLGVSSKKVNRKNELLQKEEPLTPNEKKELELIHEMLEKSKDSALRVKGKISSDVELYIGVNVLKILDEKSYLDYYIDPETYKITFRAYDDKCRIPVLVKEANEDEKIMENI
ncbi:MAG: FapA family protein, partial [Gammaproteobacteria bacterium]|nr:FapA family protein [Gammaproteobacteria bacterium]